MATQPIQQFDVDELAREKVQEVETLLETTDNIKLGAINSWLSILKQIITAADLHRTNDKNGDTENIKIDESIYADYADDNERFNSVDLTEQFATNSVKWTIRVKAFKLVHRLVQMSSTSKSLVLKQLPDLIRLSFVAATSPYDDLKIQGFEMFKFLINRFAAVEESEYPGHSILEQYRTQVLSALKPAFNLDAPPYITAIASQVCCLWISRGLEREPSDLKRTYQLMILTIDKLENQSFNQNSKLYTESELEQERLDILGSWAHLYITAKDSTKSHELLILVQPQLDSLIDKWWEALKDYALLIMPAPRIIGTSHDSEHVYTREVALRLFAPVWYKLILASTSWLCSGTEIQVPNENGTCDKRTLSELNKTKYFKFICGILMRELCRCHSEDADQRDSLAESTLYAIRSLNLLVNNEQIQSAFNKDIAIAQEFHAILYSILISSTKLRSQHQLCLRNSIEQIFNLVAKKFSGNLTNLKYAIANHAVIIDRILSNLEELIKLEEKLKLSILKLSLSIVINQILGIIRLAPDIVVNEKELNSSLTDIFKKLIRLEPDLLMGMTFLEHAKGLCVMTSEVEELLESVLKTNQANDTEHESKSKVKVDDKPTMKIKKTGPSKPAAKITLRADFSNFYAKKS